MNFRSYSNIYDDEGFRWNSVTGNSSDGDIMPLPSPLPPYQHPPPSPQTRDWAHHPHSIEVPSPEIQKLLRDINYIIEGHQHTINKLEKEIQESEEIFMKNSNEGALLVPENNNFIEIVLFIVIFIVCFNLAFH